MSDCTYRRKDNPASPRSAPPRGGAGSPRRTRIRKAVRLIGITLVVLLVAAAGAAWWALDEYVIDHVEIADVATHEAEVLAGTELAELVDLAPTEVPTTTEVSTTTATAAAEPEPTNAEAVVTATGYESDRLTVNIETVVDGTGADTVTYYVADVVVADATVLRAGFADNSFGENIIADTSVIAADYDAVLAINGDYYGFRDSGIVIRNGVVYRDDGARTGLVAYLDGTMAVYDETTTTADELLADGAWNTWSFGPAIVDGGEILAGIEDVEVDTNFGNHSIQGTQPRSGVGVIEANHFVFVVVDGRSRGYSRGVTMTEFAQIFVDLGATTAYNLDGGGSSTLVFNGDVVNNPLGKGRERGTSDILYVA